MFRKLIATSPVWMPVPLRLGLGVIFVGHGRAKNTGQFQWARAGEVDLVSSSFSFYAAGLALDGRRGVCRVDWRHSPYPGVANPIGGVLAFLYDADCADRSALERWLVSAHRLRICIGIAGRLAGALDFRRRHGFC